MNLIVSIFVYLILFLLGRSFCLTFLQNKKNVEDTSMVFSTNITIFYPLLGLFYLGNFLFILNFFTPLDLAIVPYLLLFPIVFNLKYPFSRSLLLLNMRNLFIFLILSISLYSANFQYDAGMYHLLFQQWIRSEKIVFGLANIHPHLGLSSISDYIATIFWLKNNFLLLQLITVTFISALFNFMMYHLIYKKDKYFFYTSIFLSVFSLLDNFGFNGGLNGFIQISGIIKPDQGFGVLYFLTSLFIVKTFLQKNIEKSELFVLIILFLFSYQLRITSSFLILPIIYISLMFAKVQKFQINSLLKLTFLSLLFIFWSLKNLIISSCAFFPLEFSCITTSWGDVTAAKIFIVQTLKFNYSYIVGQNIISWFSEWITFNLHYSTVLNLFGTLLFIFFLKLFILKKDKTTYIKVDIQTKFFIIFNLFSYFSIWILGSPEFRFYYGGILFIVSVFAVNSEFLVIRFKMFKKLLIYLAYFTFLSSVILVIRINTYINFFSNPFPFYQLDLAKVEYVYDGQRWFNPKKGDQCWDNILCVPSKINIIENVNQFGYRVFTYKN